MLRARTMNLQSLYGRLVTTLVAATLLAVAALSARAQEADAVPVDDNVLVGVGLVIGLAGTGDSTVDQAVVDASIVGVLKRAGLDPWRGQIKPGRVAVVMVSAELPGGSGDGAKFDVNVTAIGDARSIAGGTLLVAPLRDGDGVVHATGQGLIAMQTSSTGTVQASAAAVSGLRQAQIADGAIIARPKPQAEDVASLN
jgi:flagellar P-ring protein precursor FlgI